MHDKKLFFCPLLLILFHSFVFSTPLYSPTWGFSVDLPEGYAYTGGDKKDRYSFESAGGAKFDLVIYHTGQGSSTSYASVDALAQDVQRRLNNKGSMDSFAYRQKKTVLMELSFPLAGAGGRPATMSGWALCMELGKDVPRTAQKTSAGNTSPGPTARAGNSQAGQAAQAGNPSSGQAGNPQAGQAARAGNPQAGQTAQAGNPSTGQAGNPQAGQAARPENPPLLFAMAYGPEGKQELQSLHFSALDSIAPEEGDRLAPGPITEFTYPRETRVKAQVFGLDLEAQIYQEDAEAAQALVDREFQILRRYVDAPNWQDAWIRFYRAIYRDSFDRLADIAFQVERKLNVPPKEDRDFADQALQWVQSFNYERDLLGSDFVNLISAATEGRGDCDSRAMLWAVILKQSNIPSALMVSRHYSHAMGLADLPGQGARFEADGKKLLVAETTAKVSIGLIGETVSDPQYWLGILFE